MPERPGVPVLQNVLRKIRLAFDTWYPWDPKWLSSKLQPLNLRTLEPGDIEWCEELYSRNERCGLPGFGRQFYTGYLGSPKHRVFIAEDDNGLRVGTFGMHRIDDEDSYVSFVMVEPELQKSGIGATMLTAAIALLEPKSSEQSIVLTALTTSMPFYAKLGYKSFHREEMRGEPLIYAGLGAISPPLIQDCRDLLSKAGATHPPFPIRLPIAESPLPAVAPGR